MSRTHARTALTLTTTVLLLAMTALPALAAEAVTKPTPEENPYLIGSLGELGTTTVVGILVGALAFALRSKGPVEADDHH